ncbi:hypothetical protein Tco_1016878 [Tanacetum coccineum]|uniref:Tf2-1-like SH3-like domain-containing protein n=1 Tax=Tanacetum coccineum TaxID=301880 RepID=A0ABQ5FPX4_9ASTR
MIVQIKNRLLMARSRQKSYADVRRKLMEFQVGDMVMLKVSPWKGVIRFGKRGKLSPRYIGPFKIVERIGSLCLQAGVLPVEIMGRRSEATQAKSNYYCFHCSMDFPDEIWYDEDVHNLRFVETEFLAIYNDALTSEVALSYEPMVSPLNNNQIDFRISFDESDDEDYTVIYDKSSFSYKIIYVSDLKTDSENDNDKANMPSFSSSEPTVEPTVSPQQIDEFNLKNEASLSECDGEEQNVIYYNDLFPFNVIYPDDLKSDKDNDDDKIDIKLFRKMILM